MLEIRLLVDDPENWIKSVAQDSGRVKIMDVKEPKQGLTKNFVEVASEKMSTEELLTHLRKSNGVVKSDLSRVDRNRVMGTITTTARSARHSAGSTASSSRHRRSRPERWSGACSSTVTPG